ncbi:MAG TPA: tetratricopeptide repeat protein [Thermoanaerobaculia bacterium]
MRVALILALLALPVTAAPPSTCGAPDAYSRALCAYQHRQFADAEKGFRAIVDAGAQEPETMKSTYFLARTLMKTGRFDDAAKLLVRIYGQDKPFYEEWQCDYLLGECRRAQGLT